MKIIKVLLAIFTLSAAAYGQSQNFKRLDGTKISIVEIDSTVNRLMKRENIQGLNLAIISEKDSYTKSYGFRHKPKSLNLDTASIVYAACFSKAVFAWLVMKLVEEKALALDTPLYRYLKKPIPEYEYFSDLKGDERWKIITARMCLSHTTGLPNVRWFHPETSVMDTLGVIKIYFTPGSKYAYSGEGFKLLQLAIEERTGQTTDQLATEKIFRPLGMSRTGFIWHESFGDENVAVGHFNNGAIDLKKKRTEAVAGGSLVTTIADYAKFIKAVMQQKGLSKKLFNEMISPQIRIHSVTQFPPITQETTTENDGINLSYGLGWGVLQCPYGKAFFKEGNGESWRNYNINFMDKGISIIIMINSENGERIFKELTETLIADHCIPWKWNGYYPFDKK